MSGSAPETPGRARVARLLVALALGTAAALHVAATGQVVAPALAGLVALGGVAAGPRLDLSQAAQALVLVGTALLTFALAVVDVPLDPEAGGPKLQYVVASGTALLSVAARLWMRAPERGVAGTWGFGFVALFCGGQVVTPLYLPLVTAFLGLMWLHAAATSSAGRHRSPRHVLVAVGMIGGAALLAGGTALGLRVASERANAFVLSQVGAGEVGFGAGAFELGSMDGMRSSDAVVLRVHGPAGERFRGQVYQEYLLGTWLPPAGQVASVPSGARPSGVITTIDFVSREQERLFLPADRRAVEVSPPGVQVDALGVPRPAGEPPRQVRFDTTGPDRLPPAPPAPADLEVPPAVAAAIGPLVASWVAGQDTPRARVAAIEARLEEGYTYSLHYDRAPEVDPVVQFLLTSRLGHCEYFASGMALAARQAGVPARVVTGFRSDETSPFSGHRIVRERDAHAWVEVHLDGAWETVDPSPRNSLEAGPAQTFLAGALDDLALAWDRWGPQVLVGLLLLVFVGLQLRTLLRDRRRDAPDAAAGWEGGPPDWLAPLLDQLAGVELVRAPSEPVEAFAMRVSAGGHPEAGSLLLRYAAHRYGGQGDSATLADLADGLRLAPPA